MTDEPDDEEFKRDMEIARGVMKKRWRVFRALAQIDAGAARHEVEAQLAVGRAFVERHKKAFRLLAKR